MPARRDVHKMIASVTSESAGLSSQKFANILELPMPFAVFPRSFLVLSLAFVGSSVVGCNEVNGVKKSAQDVAHAEARRQNELHAKGSPIAKLDEAMRTWNEKAKKMNSHLGKLEADVAANRLTKEGKQAAVREGLDLAKSIDPFFPQGVDPEWASAVRRVKEAYVAQFEAYLEVIEGGSITPNAEACHKALKLAATDLAEVDNKLRFKYNVK
jgi:hypothetical protein